MRLPCLSVKIALNKESLRSISNPPYNSGQAHEILDDEPSASEWGPRKGFKNDKAQCW